MQDSEESILNTLELPVYFRYVDDILLIFATKNELDDVLKKFNNYHQWLRFIMKKEENHFLNFFDISLIRKDNKIVIKK